MPPHAGPVVAVQDDATVENVITKGRASMPSWGGQSSDEEADAVIAYLPSEQGRESLRRL